MNILYLEDEPDEANLVVRYMRATLHHLTLAVSVPEARAALNRDFDLMLVDIKIDDTREGYDFVKAVRADDSRVTIIAVTGLSFESDLDKCYAVGCNDVLKKPFTITQLDNLIKRYSS